MSEAMSLALSLFGLWSAWTYQRKRFGEGVLSDGQLLFCLVATIVVACQACGMPLASCSVRFILKIVIA